MAYILKLLDQDALFDSLHWFQSIKENAINERNAANSHNQDSFFSKFKSGNSQQTLKLTLQMIERTEKEFDLLETTVHSARILFN